MQLRVTIDTDKLTCGCDCEYINGKCSEDGPKCPGCGAYARELRRAGLWPVFAIVRSTEQIMGDTSHFTAKHQAV